MKVLTPVLNIS